MKAALQEAEDTEADGDENNGRLRLKDAKGREILSPEKKEEKKAAEASVPLPPLIVAEF